MPMKLHLSLTLAALLFSGGIFATEGTTHSEARSSVRRGGEPDYVCVEENDKAMDLAVQKARKSVGKFVAALREPKTGQSEFR